MAGRGATTFEKRQKEMQRKEKQNEKFAKRMERKKQPLGDRPEGSEDVLDPGADAGADAKDSQTPGV
jgi:hypothetical protein